MHLTVGRLDHVWGRRGLLSLTLLPLSWLFGALVKIRRALYRWGVFPIENVSAPVIVVGNLRVGGTGKTPLVIALVELLRTCGFVPGVISRGYGGSYARGGRHTALVDHDDARLFGDEIVLVWRRCQVPAAVGKSRANAARELLGAHPEVNVIVSDDGLQHYGLARTIELVVWDERGMGNGRLLPAGPLREPIGRLRTVSAIVYNGTPFTPPQGTDTLSHYTMQIEPGLAYQLAHPTQKQPLCWFDRDHGLAAAGIGNPPRFFAMLRSAGLSFTELALPDHFDYRTEPFDARYEWILITEKDAVKCNQSTDARIWVVPIFARLDVDFEPFIVESLRAPQ